jgi:hypothetical protein
MNRLARRLIVTTALVLAPGSYLFAAPDDEKAGPLDVAVRRSDPMHFIQIDGRQYIDVARSEFEVGNRISGDTTRFQMTYGTGSALPGGPAPTTYQPRWWFEVQLSLGGRIRF